MILEVELDLHVTDDMFRQHDELVAQGGDRQRAWLVVAESRFSVVGEVDVQMAVPAP
jgi:hypothetical protein